MDLVPADEEIRPRTAMQHPDERPLGQSFDARSTVELNALLAAERDARGRADRADARADRAEARSGRAEARADATDADRRAAEARADRLDQALAGERERADTLRYLLNAAQVELVAARETEQRARAQPHATKDEATELRQANAVRRAKGLVGRLRVAWPKQ